MASRKVTVEEAKLNLDELLNELASGNGELLIELNRDTVFVVLPLATYDPRRLAGMRFSGAMEEAGRTANLDPEEADRLAEEAVRWARANKGK